MNRTTIAAFFRYLLAVWLTLGVSCVAQQVLTTVTDPNGRAPRDVAVNPVANRI